ncbi:MAG: EamA family transporter, partial [Spirochaetota bacterium]
MEQLFIAARILLNPAVNVCQKRLTAAGISPIHLVFFTYLACAAVSLPSVIFIPHAAPGKDFYITILLLSVFGTAGNALLMLALTHSDLSIFGPINSFKPVIGL